MTKKKSYNPFKMWGSWIGALISIFIIFPIISNKVITLIGTLSSFEIGDLLLSFSFAFIYPLSLILFGALGFLLGWGIHSLIRSLKK